VADHLEQALQSAAELESQHPLLIAGRDNKALLASFQDHAALSQPASRLLRQVVEFEQSIPRLRRHLRQRASAVPFASASLRIQALGRVQVTLDGRTVTSSEWQTQTARDLFFCLLSHPDGLTKEEIGAIFWPDSSPSQVKLKFKNGIYRLRQALAQDAVLFSDERYHFNRELDYEYDVETFLAKLGQAQTATDATERATAYQAMLLLYKGPYLPGVEADWAWWERERLRQAYLEAMLKLAESYLETKEYRVALDYCQRVLSEDQCLEEAHRLAMRAHAAMGNRAAVVRQFDRCQHVLREEVNAPPSPQTVGLYEALVR
jgi:two-component SAPR family response regulator